MVIITEIAPRGQRLDSGKPEKCFILEKAFHREGRQGREGKLRRKPSCNRYSKWH
jgi:hypothetical protein